MKYQITSREEFFVPELKILLRKNKSYVLNREEFENSPSLKEAKITGSITVIPYLDNPNPVNTADEKPSSKEKTQGKIQEKNKEGDNKEILILLQKIYLELQKISSQKPQVFQMPLEVPKTTVEGSSSEVKFPPSEEIPYIPSIQNNVKPNIQIQEETKNSESLQDSLRQLRIKKNGSPT